MKTTNVHDEALASITLPARLLLLPLLLPGKDETKTNKPKEEKET